MIVVIQCAGGKIEDAGRLRDDQGQRISFVAHPELVQTKDDIKYAHPDEAMNEEISWRDKLLSYNQSPSNNPLGLLPAYRLYKHNCYRALADKFGLDRTYILSAGWGLIPACFLTPMYDITFSGAAPRQSRRRKDDAFRDFSMLPPIQGNPSPSLGDRHMLIYLSTSPNTFEHKRLCILQLTCHLTPLVVN